MFSQENGRDDYTDFVPFFGVPLTGVGIALEDVVIVEAVLASTFAPWRFSSTRLSKYH